MPNLARGFLWLLLALLGPGLSSCGSFRLHDAGRMQTATDAAKLAAELSRAGGGVFAPMEENLDTIRTTQATLRRLTEAHEQEIFLRILPQADADTLAERLTRAMIGRQTVFDALARRERAAAVAVNTTLDRQQRIVESSGTSRSPRTSVISSPRSSA